jgi:hypothetical protein
MMSRWIPLKPLFWIPTVISCFLRSAKILTYYPVFERSNALPSHQNRGFLGGPVLTSASGRRWATNFVGYAVNPKATDSLRCMLGRG